MTDAHVFAKVVTSGIEAAARRVCPTIGHGKNTYWNMPCLCTAIAAEMHGLVETAEHERNDAVAAANQYEVSIASMERVRDRLAAEIASMKPVVEAALAYERTWVWPAREVLLKALAEYREATKAL